MIVKRKTGTGPIKKITCFICIILTVMLITGCANRGGPTEEGGGFSSSCAPADARETTEASENQMILSFINIGKASGGWLLSVRYRKSRGLPPDFQASQTEGCGFAERDFPVTWA